MECTPGSAQPWAEPRTEHGDGPQNMECAADAGRRHVSPRRGVYLSLRRVLPDPAAQKRTKSARTALYAGKASHTDKQNGRVVSALHMSFMERIACVPGTFHKQLRAGSELGLGEGAECGSASGGRRSPQHPGRPRGRVTLSYLLPANAPPPHLYAHHSLTVRLCKAALHSMRPWASSPTCRCCPVSRRASRGRGVTCEGGNTRTVLVALDAFFHLCPFPFSARCPLQSLALRVAVCWKAVLPSVTLPLGPGTHGKALPCRGHTGPARPLPSPSPRPCGGTCGRCFPATTMPSGVRSRICHTRS